MNAKGSCPSLVSRAKVSMADPSSRNPKAFNDSLGLLTVGFGAQILAHLKKYGARKELRGREEGKRKKLGCFVLKGKWEITVVGRR